MARVVERFGKLTGLVNNAAGNFLAQTEKLSPNGFRTVVDIVLTGSFHATLAAGRRMIEQGEGGTVLSIVTTYAWTGSAFVVPSAVAKAGRAGDDPQPRGRVGAPPHPLNAIAPGPFPTEGAFSRADAARGSEEAARAQGARSAASASAHELADLAAFLMSARRGIRQRRGGDDRRRRVAATAASSTGSPCCRTSRWTPRSPPCAPKKGGDAPPQS